MAEPDLPPETHPAAAGRGDQVLVLAAIESLRGTLAMARALTLAGREVDLAGLDAEAGRLCAALACLPAADGRALRPPVIELRAELDRLAAALRAA